MKEEWLEIYGYSGDYLVSNLGRIASFKSKNPIILNPFSDKDGYKMVTLCMSGKKTTKKVHRIVINTFKKTNPSEVNHINGIKEDNRLCNLEESNRKLNAKHASECGLMKTAENHGMAKLSNNDVFKIVDLLKENNHTLVGIASFFCVSFSTIQAINEGRKWTVITNSIVSSYPISKKTSGQPRKLSIDTVREIKALYSRGFSNIEISKKLSIDRKITNHIVNGRTYKDVTI